MGCKNSPATLQRVMEHVFGGIQECQVYMDDLPFGGYSATHFMRVFERILKQHITHGMITKWAKAQLWLKELKILGLLVSYNCIRPDPAYIHDLLDLGMPRNVKELQMFTGALQWLAEFLPVLT